MQVITAILLFFIGCCLGLKAPDMDLWLRWSPLIVHRSLLTHGCLLPLLLYARLGRNAKTEPCGWAGSLLEADETAAARCFVMGFCLALAVHLCFDLVPRGWSGFAQIYAPFFGFVGTLLSFIWLLMGAFVSLYLACRLLRRIQEFGLCVAGLIVTYGVAASAEPRASFYALLWLLPLAFVAFVLPRRLRLRMDRHSATLSGKMD